jgi:multidrug resistance efflux pump
VSPDSKEPTSQPQATREETPGQRQQQQGRSPRWRRFPWILGAGLVLVGSAALAYYFLYGQYHVKTKDAYV